MAWGGSLTSSSAVGSKITFTPDTSTEGGYTVSSFKAPKKGVYQFELKGSGGSKGLASLGPDVVTDREYYSLADGGTGGKTIGYLLLEKDQVVYVGCGGTCSAAFIASATGANLSGINKDKLLFVAGAGGAGGSYGESNYKTGWNCYATKGGMGGGSSGASGDICNSYPGGSGGTQSIGGQPGGYESSSTFSGGHGSYGVGGVRTQNRWQTYVAISGRGGDGYYGGGGGHAYVNNGEPNSARAYGGGGGSGYVKTAKLTVKDKTYTSSTSQGGGATSGNNGSVTVTYYARAELPIIFDGTQLERIIFDGVEIESLIYNGTKLFIERIKRRFARWYTSTKTACRSRIPI